VEGSIAASQPHGIAVAATTERQQRRRSRAHRGGELGTSARVKPGAPILRFQRRSSSGPPKQDPGWAGPGKLLLQFFFSIFYYFVLKEI
jgi:hypothetical protein